MPQISMIIPVYNVENYLKKCLDSILKQDYQDWEALLVDDGSTDNSGMICDEYAAKDSRFKVFHKSNEGVSSARNMGLDNACGSWIWFIDPDDWITEGALLIISEYVIEYKCDTLFFGIEYINEQGDKIGYEDRDLVLYKPKDVIIAKSDYPPQNYLLKRDIVEAFGLRFSDGIKIGEDLEFQYKYLMLCKSPISIDKRLYICLRREGSAMRNSKTLSNMAQDSPKILENIVNFIITHKVDESHWLSARLNRMFKSVMSSNYNIPTYRVGVQECLRMSNQKLKYIGFKEYSDIAVRIGVANIHLYFLFQTLRKIIRK